MKPDRSRPPLEGRFAALQPASSPASGATPANRDRLVVWMKAHSRVALDRAQREIAPAARAVRGPHRQEPNAGHFRNCKTEQGGHFLRSKSSKSSKRPYTPARSVARGKAQYTPARSVAFRCAPSTRAGLRSGLLSVRASHGSGRRNVPRWVRSRATREWACIHATKWSLFAGVAPDAGVEAGCKSATRPSRGGLDRSGFIEPHGDRSGSPRRAGPAQTKARTGARRAWIGCTGRRRSGRGCRGRSQPFTSPATRI